MKRRDLKLSLGGLMRCCAQSVVDWVNADPDAEAIDGEVFPCKFEGPNPATMIVDRDTIRWHDPDYPRLSKP
jgi:hypothetical protein